MKQPAWGARLISDAYLTLNRKLHKDRSTYGRGGAKYAAAVERLKIRTGATSVLDYGAGKGTLAQALPFPIQQYDPAVQGIDQRPEPADLVVCLDVLEHVEPEKLRAVLRDIRRCMVRAGYFVIHTGPAHKALRDGRNAHLIQQPRAWWEGRLQPLFKVKSVTERPPLLHVIVLPKPK